MSVETGSMGGMESPVGSGSCTDNVLVMDVARSVVVVAATETAVAIIEAASATDELEVTLPFSMASTTFSAARLFDDDGMKRVHQKTRRRLRSTKRCLRMNKTTSMKNTSAAMMSMRSSQSDFSSAVTRCLEVTSRLSKTSCVEEADFKVAVD